MVPAHSFEVAWALQLDRASCCSTRHLKHLGVSPRYPAGRGKGSPHSAQVLSARFNFANSSIKVCIAVPPVLFQASCPASDLLAVLPLAVEGFPAASTPGSVMAALRRGVLFDTHQCATIDAPAFCWFHLSASSSVLSGLVVSGRGPRQLSVSMDCGRFLLVVLVERECYRLRSPVTSFIPSE